jgi:quercetin dioxygenase-like cupin family protein
VTATARHPYTVTSGGGGERLTFRGVVPGERGETLRIDSRVAPGAGPPFHLHRRQDEGLTVRSGRIGYQLAGGPERFAEAGAAVTFRAGEMHRFWNAGDDELVIEGWASPPGNLEFFLSHLIASGGRGDRPNPLDAAFLLRRYRSELRLGVPPAPVQRIVFPLLYALGKLTGRHRRFAGAPAPLP